MRSTDPALIAFLQSSPGFWSADLFTIGISAGTSTPSIPAGTVFNWTSTNAPITYNGTTWQAAGPKLTRSRLSQKNTIEVPELELTIDATAGDLLGGAGVIAFANNGGFDAARVTLSRAFMPAPANTAFGVIPLFNGRVSAVQAVRGQATLTVKGDSLLLNQKAPHNLYEPACIHSLYDIGCALLRTHYSWSNTVGPGGGNAYVVPGTALTAMGTTPQGAIDPAAFTQGSITFTGGVCAGQTRGIRAASAAGLQLAYPLDALPAPGDPFTITYGCDHTQPTCAARFNNTGNYRAFPYIPPAETSA